MIEENNMKVYISGGITGADIDATRMKFKHAEEFINCLGLKGVNPFDNGLEDKCPWIDHMCRDIKLLYGCDAIYMLEGWNNSLGACIEYDIAIRLGKEVLFESQVVKNSGDVLKIQNAIHEVTGLQLREYRQENRKRDLFFARMIFIHECRKKKMKLVDISRHIRRDHTTMLHSLKQYRVEYKFNPIFKCMADKVDFLLQ